jgi:hypothetical protein
MTKCTYCKEEHKLENTGCGNSGDYNSGYYNSGYYNSGDGNFLSRIIGINGFNTVAWDNITLPDTVLQYVDDILGGKVIKQEGTKCLVIDKDGNVKTGLTKQKADKGFSYKLVRI